MAFSSVSFLREYKHTRLSKVHVRGLVSNIYNRLVKDRVSALPNLREIMIMQMRYSSECSQTRGRRKKTWGRDGECEFNVNINTLT